jgi:hypothetical protein
MSIFFVILHTLKQKTCQRLDNSHWFGIFLKIMEIRRSCLFAFDGSAPGNNYLLAQKFFWIRERILAVVSRKSQPERHFHEFGEVVALDTVSEAKGSETKEVASPDLRGGKRRPK